MQIRVLDSTKKGVIASQRPYFNLGNKGVKRLVCISSLLILSVQIDFSCAKTKPGPVGSPNIETSGHCKRDTETEVEKEGKNEQCFPF